LETKDRNVQAMDAQYARENTIDDHFFVETSSRYVRQLLSVKDWRAAMIVCLLMPSAAVKHDAIRSKLMFELVTS